MFCFCAQQNYGSPVSVNAEGVAINGYDPVAYFKENKAVKGLSELKTTYQGVTYYFSSSVNQEGFIFDPTKYLPEFGGYCAYAVSQNSIIDADPTVFSIQDGRLLLQLNKKVQKIWNKRPTIYLKKADKNWPSLLKKLSK